MHPNERLICAFYEAFDKKDYKTMQNAYHPQACFSDPVFQNLSASEVRAMWEMLTRSAGDLKINFRGAEADDHQGQCRWEARYTFSGTGRPVHNVIDASFRFEEGKILH
ncbi:MAG: nuclear transport factor 2 family protein, partial [Cyclobacteriaceae bacterium]